MTHVLPIALEFLKTLFAAGVVSTACYGVLRLLGAFS
jgi:hypothetical protein